MLAFGNKEFRNLQEQVLENMRQIDDIKQAAVVLDEFGIKVIGQLESADELPDPETYEGEFGDAYAVGTEAPYELYIWTRGDSLGNNAYWFDIGAFPQAGPQGEQGPRGEQGPSGTIAFGSMSVTTTEPGTNANVSFTNIGTATNAVYNLSWYIPRGAQGIPGETGATGATGATGPQGPKGDKGDTGTGYIIMGQLDSALDLPDPGATDRQAAYLVGASEPYDLYVIVGTIGHLEWFDAGPFTTSQADINQFEAGFGLTLDEVDSKIEYAVDTNNIPTHTDVAVAINSLSSSIASTYATQASLSSYQSDVASAFSSVYASISALSSVYATPSDVGTALSNAEVYADGIGLEQKGYTDTSIEALSSVYATPAQVSSAISALTIPSITASYSDSYWTSMTLDGVTKDFGAGGGTTYSAGSGIEISGSTIQFASRFMPDFSNGWGTSGTGQVYFGNTTGGGDLNVAVSFGSSTGVRFLGRTSFAKAILLASDTIYAGNSSWESAAQLTLPSASGTLATLSDIPSITASYSGSYWTEMTLNGVTKEFGAGGGGGSVDIDNKTIIENQSGELETAIGGWVEAGTSSTFDYRTNVADPTGTPVWTFTFSNGQTWEALFEAIFGSNPEQSVAYPVICSIFSELEGIDASLMYAYYWGTDSWFSIGEVDYSQYNNPKLIINAVYDNNNVIGFTLQYHFDDHDYPAGINSDCNLYIKAGTPTVYHPFDGRFIPIDDSTIKLSAGGNLYADCVTSIGGYNGDISIGTGLSIDNGILYATGGGGGGGTYTAGSNISIANGIISLSNQVVLGAGATTYFQSPRFRGEGTESTFYHAIDYGYAGHNQVDNYEYGCEWNFWNGSNGQSKTYPNDAASLCLGVRSSCVINGANTFYWPSQGGTIARIEDIQSATAGVAAIGGLSGTISLGGGLSADPYTNEIYISGGGSTGPDIVFSTLNGNVISSGSNNVQLISGLCYVYLNDNGFVTIDFTVTGEITGNLSQGDTVFTFYFPGTALENKIGQLSDVRVSLAYNEEVYPLYIDTLWGNDTLDFKVADFNGISAAMGKFNCNAKLIADTANL